MDRRMESLVIEHVGHVRRLAVRYQHMPIEYDDLVQVGCEALVKCALRYDRALAYDLDGDPFWGYAIMKIRGAMIDELRHWTKADRKKGAPKPPLSLELPQHDSEGETLGDTLEAVADCYFLADLLRTMPRQDQEICLLLAWGLRLAEVAAYFGVTPSRISQRRTRARRCIEMAYA